MAYSKSGYHGASAGGHLASTAATHYTAGTRPDFQILFYPVISMDLSNCHKGSRDNLLGKSPSEELVRLYSNELQVTGDTPPAFIMHSSDDGAVPVSNSVSYYLALVKNKVPASSTPILSAATAGASVTALPISANGREN